MEIIYLASDHAGFEHKNAVFSWLQSAGYAVEDCGAFTHDSEDDFTDFISVAAAAVSHSPIDHKAIIFGGSGQGEAILANRFPGVRAAVFYGGPMEIVTLSREHNNANVLSLGARFVSIEETKQVITQWLDTKPLALPKYKRRNQKIAKITKTLSDFLAQEIG